MILLDSNHHSIKEFISELKVSSHLQILPLFMRFLCFQLKIVSNDGDDIPFEFVVLEAMLMEMVFYAAPVSSLFSSLSLSLSLSLSQFSLLDERLSELGQALKEVLERLLDPRLFSVDR